MKFNSRRAFIFVLREARQGTSNTKENSNLNLESRCGDTLPRSIFSSSSTMGGTPVLLSLSKLVRDEKAECR